jgi:hypothetical protein
MYLDDHGQCRVFSSKIKKMSFSMITVSSNVFADTHQPSARRQFLRGSIALSLAGVLPTYALACAYAPAAPQRVGSIQPNAAGTWTPMQAVYRNYLGIATV